VKMKEPKRYKTKLKRELVRFFEEKDRSVEQFCIEINNWLLNHKLMPVEGTPFKRKKDDRLYEIDKYGRIFHYGSKNEVIG